MAEINITDQVDADLDTVFKIFRDEMTELIPYLPDVKDIEVKERERIDDDTLKVVNLWKAEPDEIPRLAQTFIKPEMLQWTDYATWRDDSWSCDWEMDVGFLSDAITCKGTTSYQADGENKTQVKIHGELLVDARQIPGVPRLGAGRIGSVIESFVVRLITPNLTQINRGVEEYLKG